MLRPHARNGEAPDLKIGEFIPLPAVRHPHRDRRKGTAAQRAIRRGDFQNPTRPGGSRSGRRPGSMEATSAETAGRTLCARAHGGRNLAAGAQIEGGELNFMVARVDPTQLDWQTVSTLVADYVSTTRRIADLEPRFPDLK